MNRDNIKEALDILNKACEEMKDGDCDVCPLGDLCGMAFVCFNDEDDRYKNYVK